MTDLTKNELERLETRLELVHFDGEGCGTYSGSACSNCYGPSPMSAAEVVKELEPLINEVIAERVHEHYWRVARDVKEFSPASYRYCSDCGTVQVLLFSGWTDKLKLTKEVSQL